MISFLKKDVLILIRDKKELAILLLMPFLLIAILGFSLGGFLETTTPELEMTVVLVNEDEAVEGAERFKRELSELSLPDVASQQLLEAVDQLNPQKMLRAMLTSEDVANLLELQEMDRQAAHTLLEQDEANAILILPPNFTYSTLNKMLLNRGDGAAFNLKLSDVSSLKAGIFYDMMEAFVYNVNYQSALGQTIGERTGEMSAFEPIQIEGAISTIAQYEPVTSMQYYTFGMVVMFVLFVAVSVSGGAFLEMTHYTYNRILLSGKNPLQFLAGKAISCTILAWIQIVILIGMSSLSFQAFKQQSARFWFELSFISICLALFTGALGALLTAINFRIKSKTASNLFSSMIVMLLAFCGGSFFPVSQMSDSFNLIGEWTPNGAALTSYIQVAQGADTHRWLPGIYRLIALAGLCLLLSIAIFPKRRLK